MQVMRKLTAMPKNHGVRNVFYSSILKCNRKILCLSIDTTLGRLHLMEATNLTHSIVIFE